MNLAALTREYLLAGHLIDRAGMPHVLQAYGIDGMREVAIDEWMAASPVYTRRTQRALGFGGDDVATIFKGMQLDIGAPHEFMDFRFAVHDHDHGEFWLASCGALMDVEPLGDRYVTTMCHHIEDPTFDATACATNPRARMRPRHRPPRVPSDRHPHCHWDVFIDDAAEPLDEPAGARALAESRAANVDLGVAPGTYSGPFDPDFRLEDLAPAALAIAADEVCLQGHLLTRAFMLALTARDGADTAVAIGHRQLTGIAGVAARRLARLCDASGLDGIAQVFELHPAFRPRAYVNVRVESGDGAVVISLCDCDALREGDSFTWAALLAADPTLAHPAIAAIAHAVDPRARVEPIAGSPVAWRVSVDPHAPPAPEAAEVTVTRFSTGADFVFRTPR